METATVYEHDGAASSTAVVRLDDAYASIGHNRPAVDIHAVDSGRTRAAWATTAADGSLYILLAETPVNGPGYVAVFDPATGAFVRMFAAELPKLPALKNEHNPEGRVFPMLGRVAQRLVVADAESVIIATY